jgi:hypothetical protein
VRRVHAGGPAVMLGRGPELGLSNTDAHPLLPRTSGDASSEEMVLMEIIDQVRARPAAP